MRLLWILSGCLAFAVAGYVKGRIDERTVHVALAFEQAQADAKAATELAALEQANRMLAQALEDAAYAEPPSATCGLPRSRVVRVDQR